MDTNKIYNAANSTELETILKEYMNDAACEWWHGLDEVSRNAIRLLNFSHSVISSMLFFADGSFDDYGKFDAAYDSWGTILKYKAYEVVNEGQEKFFPSLTKIVRIVKEMNEARDNVTAKIVVLGLSEKVQRMVIRELLSKDKHFQSVSNAFYSEIDKMRKSTLWEAIEKIKKEDKGE